MPPRSHDYPGAMIVAPMETSRPRVLVVDDEPLLRTTVCRVLRREGFAVEEAASGDEALALAVRAPFALVVSDIEMPGMTGVELLAALTDCGSDLPVLLMSGHGLEQVRAAQRLHRQVRGVLAKPFTPTELLAAVRHALRW